MPTLKLHYDGWIALPIGVRQTLGLNSGDRIEADLVDGTLVLRPAAKPGTGRTAAKSTRARATDGDPAAAPKRRGRAPKADSPVEPSASAHPLVGIGPAKLVKKVELEMKEALPEAPPVPAKRIRPDRVSQSVERRPFRNVEIRPLGPGRGHSRPRRQPSGAVA